MPSPPKPWEVNNANAGTPVVTSPTTAANLTSTTTLGATSAPVVPSRDSISTSTLTTPARPASMYILFFLSD